MDASYQIVRLDRRGCHRLGSSMAEPAEAFRALDDHARAGRCVALVRQKHGRIEVLSAEGMAMSDLRRDEPLMYAIKTVLGNRPTAPKYPQAESNRPMDAA